MNRASDLAIDSDIPPVSKIESGPTVVPRIPAVPLRDRLHGPLLARRLRVFYLMQALLVAAGMAPVLLGAASAWKAFGLGIIFPGAGFLYAGGVLGLLLALGAFILFMASLFLWWARSIFPLPGLMLVGTAALSAVFVGADAGWPWMEWATPLILGAVYVFLVANRRRHFSEGLERAKAINNDLPNVRPRLRDTPVAARPEMSAPQIAEFRRMMDLALQPLDEWKGFTWVDQWQEGAVRYQISTSSWNLAMCQYTQLPAFHGYLNTAQKNLILKHIDQKTWSYWKYESLWGNFAYEKDPVRIDNIMLSGFLALSVGMFESSSGTHEFEAPDALTFQWNDKTKFPYGHRSLCQTIVDNYKRYDLGWFPCEPDWVYSMCNLVGLNGLIFHDTQHGTDFAAQVLPRFKRTLDEEMTLSDGRIRTCTSSRFGLSIPSLAGLFGETWGIKFMTACFPGEAERLWEIMKRQFISRGPDGQLQYKLLDYGWDKQQPSDYLKRWPDINPLVMTLWAALEMGDTEIVESVGRTLDAKYGAGIADAMTWSTAGTIRSMATKGLPQAWRTGPFLAQANYPEVIVARAVSDGDALSLVLHPGNGAVRTPLEFARLKPHARYRVRSTGETLQASSQGTASLSVALNERMELDLVPST